MENLFEVQAEARTDQGKGASRRLRHAGKVPAVVYGAEKEPVSISVNHNQFIRHLAEEAFYAHILTLVIDGKKNQVVLKDLQRHPANDNKIIHADFLRVDAKHAMTMTIPLHFINEEKAVGVKAGGLVSHLMTEVEISCLPKDLPEYIEIDVAKLAMDEAIHLSELKLPKGVTLTALTHTQDEQLEEGERSSYDQAVVSIHEPRVAKVDLEEDTEADDEEEATED
ncbi:MULTISPECIES: 50S ribosomal protein L25/general stress protein Ctc [unclassified Methylophaga]|uniref:50S ribosomal protein L25/general stress protein Ctc n=2 Tax=Methylophaga TaxID=40222 RepID=UPI000C6BDC53|nr:MULTISPECIES: 50S ribosomal protein L25/general stress protein Ctc [unclassified Methylophaga]MAL50491.1 50S ribosomal protein L25/general stress protein Ctc [Methylophaga sp.]MAP28111.1 50S ribosomal protein L25/general stress protein Ctc [Methylophaga sp.]MBP26030.1 50S ribosomal protein L25/general stress protein Ctc [Methylophaga sp.]HAD31375.1 50S ribosomal protein L25 [Methylophaga sp.]HCC82527.1 50S ribosomal protein L25 [Methylophaga sp.]